MHPKSVSVGVFLLVLILAVIWWKAESVEVQVPKIIQTMQEAKRTQNNAVQKFATQQFVRLGERTPQQLILALKKGTRARRLAIQTLFLKGFAMASLKWKTSARKALTSAWEDTDWRTRELVLNVLLHITRKRVEREKWIRAGLEDVHPFLRFLAMDALRRERQYALSFLSSMHKVMKTGAVDTNAQSHAGHHHGHNHAHDHHESTSSTNTLKKHLRERSSCVIDRDDDWPIRLTVVRGLSTWNLPSFRATGIAFSALKDRNADVQKAARKQLQKLGARAVPTLYQLFHKGSANTKYRVTDVLSQMPKQPAEMLWKLFREKLDTVWRPALKGLMHIAKPSSHVVQKICSDWRRVAPDKQRAIAVLFSHWSAQSPESTACAVQAVQNTRSGLQKEALYSLSLSARSHCPLTVKGQRINRKTHAQTCSLWAQQVEKVFLLGYQTPALHSTAMWGLQHLGRYAAWALPLLRKQMKRVASPSGMTLTQSNMWIQTYARIGSHKKQVRRDLFELLQHLNALESIKVLLRTWALPGKWFFSLTELQALAVFLEHPSLHIREAVHALYMRHGFSNPALAPWLVQKSLKMNAIGRASVAYLFGLWKHWPSAYIERWTTFFVQRSIQDPSLRVQSSASFAWWKRLGQKPSRISAQDWSHLLKHRSVDVRVHATQALKLGKEKGAFVLGSLLPLLRDPKRRVRLRAAQAVGAMKLKALSAVSALCATMKDQSVDVQLEAKRALGQIRHAEDQFKGRKKKRVVFK